MCKEIIKFGDTEVVKRKFHHRKKSRFVIKDVDIKNIQVSSIVFKAQSCFIVA